MKAILEYLYNKKGIIKTSRSKYDLARLKRAYIYNGNYDFTYNTDNDFLIKSIQNISDGIWYSICPESGGTYCNPTEYMRTLGKDLLTTDIIIDIYYGAELLFTGTSENGWDRPKITRIIKGGLKIANDIHVIGLVKNIHITYNYNPNNLHILINLKN